MFKGRSAALTSVVLLIATVLAGCSDSGQSSQPADLGGLEVGKVEATSTTGGIRGVVVDQAIMPVTGATVRVLNTELMVETDDTGVFTFSGLDAGTYFVEATKPLYDAVQQAVEVEAGVAEPDIVKFQLNRLVAQDPYVVTEKYEGFISCSANFVIVLSEECGEGVGVPGQGRVGGQENNRAQIDFTVDGPFIESLIIEQVWEPSISLGTGGGGFRTIIATDWSCEPVCGGNRMADVDGQSPLYISISKEVLDAQALTPQTTISSFTWASAEETGVLLEQEFELFVTASYYLPLPEGWSFINGDPTPF